MDYCITYRRNLWSSNRPFLYQLKVRTTHDITKKMLKHIVTSNTLIKRILLQELCNKNDFNEKLKKTLKHFPE